MFKFYLQHCNIMAFENRKKKILKFSRCLSWLGLSSFTWLKYCLHDVKRYPINKSINQLINQSEKWNKLIMYTVHCVCHYIKTCLISHLHNVCLFVSSELCSFLLPFHYIFCMYLTLYNPTPFHSNTTFFSQSGLD